MARQDRVGSPSVRRLIWAGVALAAIVVALSPTFGRAHPTGSYRPDLPPDALATGCYPLPSGLHFDFDLQLRSDDDMTSPAQRRMVLQFDRIDATTAESRIAAAFGRAGFVATTGQPGASMTFTKAGVGAVSAKVVPLPDVGPDDLVRGTIELVLPPVRLSSTNPECEDRFSTKRFKQWEAGQ